MRVLNRNRMLTIHPTINDGVNFNEKFLMLKYLGCKAKAIPLQAWTGPEGSRRLRLPDFKTIGT